MYRLAWLLLVLTGTTACAEPAGVLHWRTGLDLETTYKNVYNSL